MATTAKGTPYVVSTDLVANYPTVSSDLATHIDAKLAYNAVSINAQTGTTYTFALADASEGKLVTASNAAASTYTVPPQSSVTWADGAVLRILNQGAGTVTIAAGAGVTINGTPLTLAQYKGAALQRTASNTWTIIPFTGGVGNAVISSPAATGSFTVGGITYNYHTITATTSVVVSTPGVATVFAVAGGGGGGSTIGGGGGAGGVRQLGVILDATTYTATVGAGGAGGTGGSNNAVKGNDSSLGALVVAEGGGQGASSANGSNGGSGGGGGANASATTGGTGTAIQGTNGSASVSVTPSSRVAGGGGGFGSAATNSRDGGLGVAAIWTGALANYAGGGGGGVQASGGTRSVTVAGGGRGGIGNSTNAENGTANTGGGGGGAADSPTTSGTGGSGIIVLVVGT